MPNTFEDGTTSPRDDQGKCKPFKENRDKSDWEKYKTTVLEIEKASGITFSSEALRN